MNVVILAGGVGSRLAEETEVRPKPMVEIGPEPILWHILRGYAQRGHADFFIALGYKGELIKRYFLDRHRLHGSLSLDLATGRVEAKEEINEKWRLHLIETGSATQTGGRTKPAGPEVGAGERRLSGGPRPSRAPAGLHAGSPTSALCGRGRPSRPPCP